MELRIKLKPSIYRGRSREEILYNLRGSWCWGSLQNGNSYSCLKSWGKDEELILYSLEKHNRKSKHIKYKSGLNKGKVKKTEVIRKASWIAYVYRIPMDILKFTRVDIKQETRHFTIKPKK